jgi:hypothetical protein
VVTQVGTELEMFSSPQLQNVTRASCGARAAALPAIILSPGGKGRTRSTLRLT